MRTFLVYLGLLKQIQVGLLKQNPGFVYLVRNVELVLARNAKLVAFPFCFERVAGQRILFGDGHLFSGSASYLYFWWNLVRYISFLFPRVLFWSGIDPSRPSQSIWGAVRKLTGRWLQMFLFWCLRTLFVYLGLLKQIQVVLLKQNPRFVHMVREVEVVLARNATFCL